MADFEAEQYECAEHEGKRDGEADLSKCRFSFAETNAQHDHERPVQAYHRSDHSERTENDELA